MIVSKIHIICFAATLFVIYTTKLEKRIQKKPIDRICDCSKILSSVERGFYLSYHEGEDTFYTGKCKVRIGNGNEIFYKYFKGHLLEIIENYPGGILNEEIYYDSIRIIKRIRYYSNGCKSYEQIFGDHTYETYYNNGRIQRKGGYGFTKKDFENKYYDLSRIRLYDSIWKEDGSFDSVYRYSKGSITY